MNQITNSRPTCDVPFVACKLDVLYWYLYALGGQLWQHFKKSWSVGSYIDMKYLAGSYVCKLDPLVHLDTCLVGCFII